MSLVLKLLAWEFVKHLLRCGLSWYQIISHYVRSSILERKNSNPKFKFYKKFESAYLLDANNAFGLAAGAKAIDKGIEIAQKKGICMIGVKNSSHPGALASIDLEQQKKDLLLLLLPC